MKSRLQKLTNEMFLEAKNRGAFRSDWNVEKDLWIKDITEITKESILLISKDELDLILNGIRKLIKESILSAKDISL